MYPKEELQLELDRSIPTAGTITVLEAGCGSGTNVSLPSNRHVVGLDISEEELEKNSFVNEKVVGDLQSHEFEGSRFDLIVCWDVLEHLSEPDKALERFSRWTKPGGLVLLAVPNYFSIKALVTKLTPHWFHIFVYRRIYGKQYGDPGLITFPTYMRRSIAPDRLYQYADAEGLEPIYVKLYESSIQKRARKKIHITGVAFAIVNFLSKVITLGRYDFERSDCIFLLRKNGGE